MTTPLIAQTAIQHYLGKGLSKDTAVGIVSCLYYESKLAPGSQGVQSTETPGALNPSGAYGIASWNGPRQAALAAFASSKGLDPSKLETQLDFVLTESANSYPKVWAAIQNGARYQDLIPIFVADYENPADHQKEIDAAMGYANAWYPDVPAAPVSPPVAQVTPPPAAPPVAPSPVGSVALTSDQGVVVQALAQAILDAMNVASVKALASAILKELS